MLELVDDWVTGIAPGRPRDTFAAPDQGVHHLQQTGNLRVARILLGHTKIESTVRYLGVDIEDALALSEGRDV